MNRSEQFPLIVAHRGASGDAPENTIAAFRLAREVGAEGIEFDVRISADKVPFVFHDSDLKRICKIDAKFNRLTAAEISTLDAGSWFKRGSKNFAGENVPRFDDTLDFLSDYEGVIFIEIKGKHGEIEETVKAIAPVINNSALKPQIIVKSFKSEAISPLRKYCPDVKVAGLFARKIIPVLNSKARLVEHAKELGVDELSLHHSLAKRSLMARAKAETLPVAVWTNDRKRFVAQAAKLGIRYILTNYPEKLLKKRRKLFGF
ncbi:MAG: glycerophosphodiester phosphodiesterase [Pyrinomonadaceae bacterium]